MAPRQVFNHRSDVNVTSTGMAYCAVQSLCVQTLKLVGVGVLLAIGIGLSFTSISGQESPQRLTPVQQQSARELPGNTADDEAIESTINVPLVDIAFEGNSTIPDAAMMKYVKTPLGRPITHQQIKDDIKALHATRWFINITPRIRRTERGLVLVFLVKERPILKRVEFRGNEKIKTKNLKAITGLQPGGPFEISANMQSVRRIENHYREKGYYFREVTLVKGGHPDDREVIIEIKEGPKVIVNRIQFEGNDFFSDSLLRTKVLSKTALLKLPYTKFAVLGGQYDPTTIPNDIAALKEYYNSLGFFDAQIEPDVVFSDDKSRVTLNYKIEEGTRYRVRDIAFIGNRVLGEDKLADDFKLKEGEYFNARHLNKDIDRIRNQYGELGRLFAQVQPTPRFLEEPGFVDMELRIDEDKPYRIRTINVHIRGDYPHTKASVAIDRMLSRPGELADPNKIRRDKSRLAGSQIFERDVEQGPRINISKVEAPREPDLAYMPRGVVRGQTTESPIPQPQNPIYGTSPQGDPFSNPYFREVDPPGWVDLDVDLSEARTGRLMFGVGVNSDNGVVGSFVLEETNFDILRPPLSPADFFNGTAWRGGGQQFRLEAVPGNVVSRYMVSWTDPYFLNSDYSVSTSGFYFKRFYPSWDEERLGGRISIGRQLTPEISVNGQLRLEEVNISDPDTPTPPILARSLGSNYLSTVRVGVSHDTRDAPFLPAEGHLLQFNFEQGFGDFVYPRLEFDGSQFYTLYSRPDGGGKHILSINGHVGWTDNDTPIFERYFAGGFQTFRGFAFRGVSPEEGNVRVGGRWLFLGGVEYMAPITADDKIQAVAFTDFGTVENDIGMSDFRLSLGAGVRLTVPAMGPAPIALDFAVPVIREEFDNEQIFSFYVGFTR